MLLGVKKKESGSEDTCVYRLASCHLFLSLVHEVKAGRRQLYQCLIAGYIMSSGLPVGGTECWPISPVEFLGYLIVRVRACVVCVCMCRVHVYT